MEKITFTTAEINETIKEVTEKGGRIYLGVTGGSMMPFLKHQRDAVFIRGCNQDEYKKGQILLFRRTDGRLILHRIRKVLPEQKLLMNGDAQHWCEVITYSQVVGLADEFERNGKKFFPTSFIFKVWNILWFPTRPVRPFIFKLVGKVKKHK